MEQFLGHEKTTQKDREDCDARPYLTDMGVLRFSYLKSKGPPGEGGGDPENKTSSIPGKS